LSSIPISPRARSEQASPNTQFNWCDRPLSAILLLVLSPLFLGIAIAMLLLSRKSPIIAHRRVGQYGSELWMLKFRTMWQHGEAPHKVGDIFSIEFIDDEIGPGCKGPEDGRVGSRFARFCRRHSLDELPQIFHVLEGRMSLVGPRPVTKAEVDKIYGADAAEILRAKPGLAGLWQVSGRNLLTSTERRALDLEWVRNQSLGLYLVILLRTVPELLFGGNTW
jgi:exopolysaccharide production protein ExoY